MLNNYSFEVSETLYYTFHIGAKSEEEAREIAESHSSFLSPNPFNEDTELVEDRFEYKVIQLLEKDEEEN